MGARLDARARQEPGDLVSARHGCRGGHAGGVAAGSWLLVTRTCKTEWGTLATGQPGQVIPAPAP